jgi:hypothetical protein
MSAGAIGQIDNRLSTRQSDFDDVNRLLNDGSRVPQGTEFRSGSGLLNTRPAVDLSQVNTRTLKNLLIEAVDESEQLYRRLNADYRRYPELRPLLSELLKLRARASQLGQDLQANIPLDRVLTQFQELDSDWRLLSHRLSQSPQLSATTKESIARIDRLDQQIGKLFELEPQLDRRKILIQLSTLDSSIRNLIEELELDPTTGGQIMDLAYDARKLQQQVSRIQGMVLDQAVYNRIVDEYNRFNQMWSTLYTKLRTVDNRYIERSTRHIMDADDALHDLMWLEKQSNRERLRQVADALTRDVDEFFNRTPLKLLVHFKDVASILETADNFYGTVQNFKDCLARNEDDRTLLDCFRYVEEYGADFVRSFAPLRSTAGRVVLREIEDGIASLRSELNLSGSTTSIDTRQMLASAANLENLADHLDLDVQQWLSRDPQSFRTEALRASTQFVQRTRRLHRLLQSRPSVTELRRETGDLYEDWRKIYSYLGQCRTEDRQHIAYLARDISTAIYNLRTPLEL